MCKADAAHLDTEKIKCLLLGEEQNESNSCYSESRLVQGKWETHSSGEWVAVQLIKDLSPEMDHSSNSLLHLQQGHSLVHIKNWLDLEAFAQETP